MTSVVSFKLEPTPKQKRILARYFGIYYSFYREAMQLVQGQMHKMYHSDEWQEATAMVQAIMTAPEFCTFTENKNSNTKSPFSLQSVRTYISTQNEALHQRNIKQVATKPKALAKENKRYESLKTSLAKMASATTFSEALYKDYLAKLKSIRFNLLNIYQLNGGTSVPLENSVRSLLRPLSAKYQSQNNMYSSTIAELLILRLIIPAIQSTFDHKVKNPKSKHYGHYAIPYIKKSIAFNSLQCGPFKGKMNATLPFKIDFSKNTALFYFPRREDNKSQGLSGKEKHSIKLAKYDSYREKLILKNTLANRQYAQNHDKSNWFFKYPTLVRKINRSGSTSYELQISYEGLPEQRKMLGHGIIGIYLCDATIALWSLNPAGSRGLIALYPAPHEKKYYLANGQIFPGSHTQVRQSKKYFLANGKALNINEAAKELRNKHATKGKYTSTGLLKSALRRRKQHYNKLIVQILEQADEFYLAKSPTNFPQSNAAPSHFEKLLKDKISHYPNARLTITEVTQGSSDLIIAKHHNLESKVPFNLYQAFLLAHTNNNFSKEIWQEFIQISQISNTKKVIKR